MKITYKERELTLEEKVEAQLDEEFGKNLWEYSYMPNVIRVYDDIVMKETSEFGWLGPFSVMNKEHINPRYFELMYSKNEIILTPMDEGE